MSGGITPALNVRFSKQPTSALGRDLTDTYSGSSPQSRRWRFACPKLPLADESSRPVAVPRLARKRSFAEPLVPQAVTLRSGRWCPIHAGHQLPVVASFRLNMVDHRLCCINDLNRSEIPTLVICSMACLSAKRLNRVPNAG